MAGVAGTWVGGAGPALADASVFIAIESREPAVSWLPPELAVSTITVGELHAGVLAAANPSTRSARLGTLLVAHPYDSIPIGDSWIAATAIAHDLAVATQDADYDVPGLRTVRV